MKQKAHPQNYEIVPFYYSLMIKQQVVGVKFAESTNRYIHGHPQNKLFSVSRRSDVYWF